MKTALTILTLAALLGIAPVASGQVIRIHKQVTIEPRQEVRLGDIATISGTDRRHAEELADTVILTAVESSRTIKAESILLALVTQRGAKEVGSSLQISGSASCAITVGGQAAGNAGLTAAPSTGTQAMGAQAIATAMVAPPPQTAPVQATPAVAAGPAATQPADKGLTLHAIITDRIVQELGIPADAVDVHIETVSPLIEAPVAAGRKWLCRPLTRTFVGTVQIDAQLVENNRILEKVTVQSTVRRKQTVVVPTRQLAKGDVIAEGDVRVDETWFDRNMPTLFASEALVVGLECQRAADVGTPLDTRNFKPALMAMRNEAINVYYRVGNLNVQMRGQAMEDGKMHDTIKIRNEKTHEICTATLIGKHLAVVGEALSPLEEQKLRESR